MVHCMVVVAVAAEEEEEEEDDGDDGNTRVLTRGKPTHFDGHRQNPASCFDVRTATLAPIDLATATHCDTLSVAGSGANFDGS
jgi:hypothetical protein